MNTFVDSKIFKSLGNLSKTEADSYGFGIVKVDNNGKIELYNKYESDLAGIPVSQAEGKNFFTEVAICTNNRIFFGRFKEGIAKGELDIVFNYVFTYKMKPTNVVIHLYHHKETKTNWVFVKFR